MFDKRGNSNLKTVIKIIALIIVGGFMLSLSQNIVCNNFGTISFKITELFNQPSIVSDMNTSIDVWNGEYSNKGLNGNGSYKHPYIISNIDDFSAFASSVENGNDYAGLYVELHCDIYLNTGVFNIDKWNNWDPIGDIEKGLFFSGIFDGNNHSINGIYVKDVDSGGLFEVVGNSSKNMTVIKNLKINNSHLRTYSDSGTLASYIVNSNIENITTNNIVLNSQTSGILSAYTIDVCFNNCKYTNITGARKLVEISHNTIFS